jgi:hypothetical protein
VLSPVALLALNVLLALTALCPLRPRRQTTTHHRQANKKRTHKHIHKSTRTRTPVFCLCASLKAQSINQQPAHAAAYSRPIRHRRIAPARSSLSPLALLRINFFFTTMPTCMKSNTNIFIPLPHELGIGMAGLPGLPVFLLRVARIPIPALFYPAAPFPTQQF